MDFKSLYDVEVLGIHEYATLMKAFRLKRVDKERDMHLQAWLNHQVSETKNVGSKDKPKEKPLYTKFDDFFNYEERIREIEGTTKPTLSKQQKRKLANIAVIANKKGG